MSRTSRGRSAGLSKQAQLERVAEALLEAAGVALHVRAGLRRPGLEILREGLRDAGPAARLRLRPAAADEGSGPGRRQPMDRRADAGAEPHDVERLVHERPRERGQELLRVLLVGADDASLGDRERLEAGPVDRLVAEPRADLDLADATDRERLRRRRPPPAGSRAAGPASARLRTSVSRWSGSAAGFSTGSASQALRRASTSSGERATRTSRLTGRLPGARPSPCRPGRGPCGRAAAPGSGRSSPGRGRARPRP